MLKFRQMRPEEEKECAMLAADSFWDYEFFTNYFPDDTKRRSFLRKLILCEMKANAGRGVTLVAEDGTGILRAVSVLYPPDYVKPKDWSYIRSGFFGACLAGGWEDAKAWNVMNEKNDAPCHKVADTWYLNSFNVAPGCKGMGIGSAMLTQCVLPYLKSQKAKTLTLVTNSEQNCRFYEKNGFTQFDSAEFDYKGKKTGSWSYRMDFRETGDQS